MHEDSAAQSPKKKSKIEIAEEAGQPAFAPIAEAPIQHAPPKPNQTTSVRSRRPASSATSESHPSPQPAVPREEDVDEPKSISGQKNLGIFALLVAGLSSFATVFGPTAKIIDIISSYGKLLSASQEVQFTVAAIASAICVFFLLSRGRSLISKAYQYIRNKTHVSLPTGRFARSAVIAILVMVNLAVMNAAYDYVSFRLSVAEWSKDMTITSPSAKSKP